MFWPYGCGCIKNATSRHPGILAGGEDQPRSKHAMALSEVNTVTQISRSNPSNYHLLFWNCSLLSQEVEVEKRKRWWKGWEKWSTVEPWFSNLTRSGKLRSDLFGNWVSFVTWETCDWSHRYQHERVVGWRESRPGILLDNQGFFPWTTSERLGFVWFLTVSWPSNKTWVLILSTLPCWCLYDQSHVSGDNRLLLEQFSGTKFQNQGPTVLRNQRW